MLQALAGIGSVLPASGDLPAVSSPLAFEGSQVLVSDLVDDLDVGAERERLDKVIAGLTKQIGGFEGKLGNQGYVNNAKPELVQETRDMLAAAQADLAAAQEALSALV